MSDNANRAWLKPILKPLMPIFREVIVMSAFVNLLALAVPIFTLQVYDRVVGTGGLSTSGGLVIGMILSCFSIWPLKQARSRVMQTVALRVDIIVGRHLFDKLMSLPLQHSGGSASELLAGVVPRCGCRSQHSFRAVPPF